MFNVSKTSRNNTNPWSRPWMIEDGKAKAIQDPTLMHFNLLTPLTLKYTPKTLINLQKMF